jgi:flagellar hook-associated protein 3 FlgL
MASVFPVPSTRTTGLLEEARLLSQLNQQQLDIQRIQNQISTGRRLATPSEDPGSAQRGQTIQLLLELKAQAQQNVRTGQSYLDATDTALSSVTSLLSDVRAQALEASSDTSTATTRAANAVEVRRAIEQLLAIGNRDFRGRYLFAGSLATTLPFSWDPTGVSYHGNEGSLDSFVDLGLPYATNASGAQVFGTYSAQVEGSVDLNPTLTANTLISDLYGGRGLTLGSIEIADGFTKQVIDLSSAATIGDVKDLIEANPPTGRTVTAQITATGLTIDIDDAGAGNLTIKEVGGGTTAADLQIHSPVGTGVTPVVGGDLNPRLRLTTPLADLQTAAPLDLASGLQITNGGQTYVIDTSSAQTVEELLNTINSSPANALAEIAPSGDHIIVRSRLSGADFAIGENGGTTATQLGIRSMTVDSVLADLNHGLGVATATGTDFTIHRKDGTDLAIDISSATTIGDVLDLINNDAANLNPLTRVEARLATFGNGIELFDGNLAGPDQLQITAQFGSDAAIDLGLIPRGSTTALGTTSASGDTLTGADVNPLEVSGVFNSLLRLYDAMTNFDRTKLERAVGLLDQDFDRLSFARGEIGGRGKTLQTIQTQLDDEEVLLKSNLSDEIDTNLPDAIANLTGRQAALQASLQLAAQVFRVSLLDFL